MTKRVALMLPLAVAAAVTHTRRATLKHTAYAVAAAAAPASAKELYYTKEEFCRISDEQSKNGIEFGCEQYVASPEKRARMRLRALDAITRASEKLDTYRVETAASGVVIRGALRREPLDVLERRRRSDELLPRQHMRFNWRAAQIALAEYCCSVLGAPSCSAPASMAPPVILGDSGAARPARGPTEGTKLAG